jgi:lysophospholipase L1-like esterase
VLWHITVMELTARQNEEERAEPLVFLLLTSAAVVWSLNGAHPLLWAIGLGSLACAGVVFVSPATTRRFNEGFHAALEQPAIRLSLASCLLVGVWIQAVFGISALLLVVAVWLGLWFQLLARGGVRAAGGLPMTSATLGLVLVLVVQTSEWVLASPSLATRFGAPSVREQWNNLYLQIRRTNSFGFRSPYEDTRRAPGTIRIAALGDSFTWGEVVERSEDLWTAQLERRLRNRHAGVPIEVVNMARPGFTTAHQAERLRRVGWQFDPQLVVVQFLANDAIASTPNYGLDRVRERVLYPQFELLPVRFRTPVTQNSALLAFIEGRVAGIKAGPVVPRLEALYEAHEPGWIASQAALREMGSAARQRGVPIVLMLFPDMLPGEWRPDDYPLNGVHRKVAAVAQAAGFEVLDLVPAFADAGGDWRRFWGTPYDAHPNPEGHALAASALDGFLQRLGWYPAALASASAGRPERAQPDHADSRQSE